MQSETHSLATLIVLCMEDSGYNAVCMVNNVTFVTIFELYSVLEVQTCFTHLIIIKDN